jgi:hypothetical protein
MQIWSLDFTIHSTKHGGNTLQVSDGFLITCSGCKNNVIGTKRDIKEIVKIVTKHQNDLNFGSKFKLRK